MRINRSTLVSLMVMGGVIASPGIVAAQVTPAATRVRGGIGEVRVIGVQTVDNVLTVDDAVVGGLSGIDYEADAQVWYVLSDDRSDMDPARFYTASLA